MKVNFILIEIKLFFGFQEYSWKDTALLFLKRYYEAITMYEAGLKIDSNDQRLPVDLDLKQHEEIRKHHRVDYVYFLIRNLFIE